MNRDGVWRKSSRSVFEGNCVGVAATFLTVAVRDEQDPDGPVLRFRPDAWRAFVDDVKAGEMEQG